jgi:plastocyanin
MKKLLLSSLFLSGMAISSKAVIHTINQVGFTFSPANTTAATGDTVIFVITGIHNATEVSSATYAANGTTPLGGGFAISAPGDTVIITSTATRYFVCTIHVGSVAMKGTINSTVGISDVNPEFVMSVYPNPATTTLNLTVSGSQNQVVNIDVVNLLGSKVMDCGGKQLLMNGVKRLDISALPRGIYFLNIAGENKNRSIRFVKE